MSLYARTRTKPRDFHTMTGLSLDAFDHLVPSFDTAWFTAMATTTMEGNRRWCRAPSSYQNSPFPSSAEKLFFILVYLRQMPTQMVQAAMFGITQPSANRWIKRTMVALHGALELQNVLPARDMESFEMLLTEDTNDHDDTPTLFFMTEPSGL